MNASGADLDTRFYVRRYHLQDHEEDQLRSKLNSISQRTAHFPTAELQALIQGSRSHDVSVKLTLILPGKTLVARDHDQNVHPAFDNCLSILEHELDAYHDQLGHQPDIARMAEVDELHGWPQTTVSEDAMQQAVQAQDYIAFRKAMAIAFEDELRNRVGRWVQRYPEINDAIGEGIEIADLVEEVFLTAFEEFNERPSNVPLGVWLEQLIDPAAKLFLMHPDDALENISVIRSAGDAPEERYPAP